MTETDRVALWAYKLARDLGDFLRDDASTTMPPFWRQILMLDVEHTVRASQHYFRALAPHQHCQEPPP